MATYAAGHFALSGSGESCDVVTVATCKVLNGPHRNIIRGFSMFDGERFCDPEARILSFFLILAAGQYWKESFSMY